MKLSVVTTVFYSENYVREFYSRTVAAVHQLTSDYEIIFVNDGSPDQSKELILSMQRTDPNIILLDLSRNFGHHRAILTGLHFATGDLVFLIDSDLEEDPELLLLFWKELEANREMDVIYGVQDKRKGEWFERVSGKLYYKFFSLLSGDNYPSNPLTARLMTKRYVDSVKSFTEKEFDLWSIFALAGFLHKGINVSKGYKGKSTYNLRKKLKMAIASITSLTTKPLYLI